jgi:fructosamine-3-kinase
VSREALVARALGEALGEDVAAVRLDPAGGGCINSAATTEVGGRRFFVKWNDRPLEAQFEAEARGLNALVGSGTSLVIPRAICWGDEGPGRSFLVLEYLPPGGRVADFEQRLGRGLAELHRASSERGFGFEVDGYCGATPQPNGWLDDWIAFYGQRRLGHQLDLARARGYPQPDYERGQRLIARLPELLGDPEPPALIHGDLWSGNLHVAPDGRPSLIDPAAYYGHREAEIGMMELFGGFGPRVYAAYEEAYPLQPGWRERVDLYSLYHVLNHYNLFGGGYGSPAARIVRRYP